MPAASAPGLVPGIAAPFPGLRPFEHDEEAILRGRRQHTAELLRRLADHRFLAVVGSSGSGKSSLVRAGLRPALDRGYLPGATSRWRFAVMRPGMAPIDNLSEALRQPEALGASDSSALRSSSLGLVETVRAAGLAPGESLLVIADQFEEIFRYQRRASEADARGEAMHFVNLLLTAAARPDAPVYVVLTMRSDFLGDCAQFPGLPEALTASQYLIPRLTREERRRAIEEPLRLFGAPITPQLVERLLNDSGNDLTDEELGAHYRGGAPDPLPLLQHALLRTWNEWRKRAAGSSASIDLVDYQAAGGTDSALDLHAESLYNTGLDETGRTWAQRIFRCLTTTELGRPVRRPTTKGDLYKIIGARPEDRADVDRVLDLFARPENSLIRIYGDSTVDLMHESLIWKWKRLRQWVATEATVADLFRDLMKDATRSLAGVWTEPKLASALALRQDNAWNELWAAQYADQPFQKAEDFLARSRRAARNQKWRRWLSGAAALAILILGIFAYQKQRELAATAIARDSLAKDVEKRKLSEKDLADRIANLNANQGATQQDRDRIAKEKTDLEAQLAQSQQDTQKLSTEAQQSTDLLSTVKNLQTRLDQLQRERDEATKGRTDAEAKVTTLTKDLEAAHAAAAVRASSQPPSPQPAAPKTDSAGAIAAPQRPSPEATQSVVVIQELADAMAWSPDGKTLATASVVGENAVRLWDSATGKLIRAMPLGSVIAVNWSADGKTVSGVTELGTLNAWQADTGRSQSATTWSFGAERVDRAVWSPDGQMLASVQAVGKTIFVQEVRTGRLLHKLNGHKDAINGIAWSPDGKTLASASRDETVRLWDAASGRSSQQFRTPGNPLMSVAWSPNGEMLAWASTRKLFITVIARASGALLSVASSASVTFPPIDIGAIGLSLAWSPDNKFLAVGTDDATIKIFDASGHQLTNVSSHKGDVTYLAWSPDGKFLASSGSDSTIHITPAHDLIPGR